MSKSPNRIINLMNTTHLVGDMYICETKTLSLVLYFMVNTLRL